MGAWKPKFVIVLIIGAVVAICVLALFRNAEAGNCPGPQPNIGCKPYRVSTQALNEYVIRVEWAVNQYVSKVFLERTPGGSWDVTSRPRYKQGDVRDYQNIDDTTIKSNVLYGYRVCAVYDNGRYCSDVADGFALVYPTHLGPPTFNVPEVNREDIRVSWDTWGQGYYDKFNLMWGEKGGPQPQVENRSGVFVAPGTLSGRTYTFKVQGYLSNEGRWTGWSPPLEVRVNLPPIRPSDFKIEGITPNLEYRLRWRGDRDAALFRIRRGRGSVAERQWYLDASAAERDYEFDVSDQLAPRTEYWFEVCAINISRQVDDDLNSSCVRQGIKTLAGIALAPTDPRAAFVSNGVQITWTANDDTVLWFEVERRENLEWKVISNKIATRRDTYFTDTNPPAPRSAAQPRMLVYRVCAGNVAGRSCSGPAAPATVGDKAPKAIANLFRILSISPSRFAKVDANPPQIDVTLTHSGGVYPKFAAYRSDGGAWVDVPVLILNSGTSRVTIPTTVFQSSARSVDIRLGDGSRVATGTIAVVNVDPTVQAKEVKGLQTNLEKQSGGPSREPPRVPDAAPKSVPPLQQQAPGKSTGSVFQR